MCFYRVKAYINYGWDKIIVNLDKTSAKYSLNRQDMTVSEFDIPSDERRLF